MIELLEAVREAEARIRPWILETPLEPSPLGPQLKLENLQHTGSFKARGAFSKLLALEPATRARGVIAASTGNHGAAVAYAAQRLGLPARIVVPELADPGKLAKIRGLGGEIEVYGDDSAVAEQYARRQAAKEGLAYLSPYNDLEVVAGQGTIGVELARQLPRADVVFIALGGGGLLAGVAAYLKVLWPGVVVVGCSPENSAVMIHSIRAGQILTLESKPTLSDGTAGGIEPGAITLELCRDLADDLLTVTEAEIQTAMRLVLEAHGRMIEGAAGVAVAGYLRQAARWKGRTAVAIVCGGNVAPAVFETMDRS
jgi:threonine dehydratase